MTPLWITAARAKLGTRETPGPGVTAWIHQMWLGLRGGAWFWRHYGSDDSKLPWCGAFCAWAMQQARHDYPARYASARAWLDWGEPCGADLGAVAVLQRRGGGHVGFVDAVSADGRFVRLLGGNQGDAVSQAWFSASRVIGYRRPVGADLPAPAVLAVGPMSLSEA
jgi:uncharacterized protein (TIGR02594 family)